MPWSKEVERMRSSDAGIPACCGSYVRCEPSERRVQRDTARADSEFAHGAVERRAVPRHPPALYRFLWAAPLGGEGPESATDLLRCLEREEVTRSRDLDACGVGEPGH